MDTLGELGLALKGLQTVSYDSFRDSDEDEEVFPLLQLPNPCLLAVLRGCADDQHSLFNAARAHSRLHQAARLALRTISSVLKDQHHADRIMQYLAQYGQSVSSIQLSTEEPEWESPTSSGPAPPSVTLHQLLQNMQGLHSINFEKLCLQLQPGSGFQGVLPPGAPVEQLQLIECELLDGEEGLAAALSLLPSLQHLGCSSVRSSGSYNHKSRFPGDALQGLQQLTYLELDKCEMPGQDNMQHLQGLTGLQDLRICPWTIFPYKIIYRDPSSSACTITASMLAGAQHLTRLELGGLLSVEPGVLSGKTRLQHLGLEYCYIAGSSAGLQELLGHLQPMQQLTHLCLGHSLAAVAPVAAYSALTASSKLQYLDFGDCRLPAGVWQHIFPPSKHLLHLQHLDICHAVQLDSPAVAPEGSRLVSCCPRLQELSLGELQCSAELLAPLTGLGSLTGLDMYPAVDSTEGLEVVCQLTGLRQLFLAVNADGKSLVAQLTGLQQLTELNYIGADSCHRLSCQAPGDEPVWRQLLHL